MDTSEVQFAVQDYYLQFYQITPNDETFWKRKNKKCIIWRNPNNGFTIAALRDINYEAKLPTCVFNLRRQL